MGEVVEGGGGWIVRDAEGKYVSEITDRFALCTEASLFIESDLLFYVVF